MIRRKDQANPKASGRSLGERRRVAISDSLAQNAGTRRIQTGMVQMIDVSEIAKVSEFATLPDHVRSFLTGTQTGPSVDNQSLAFLYNFVQAVKPRYALEIGLANGSSASCHALASQESLERFDIIDPLQKSGFRNAGLEAVKQSLGSNVGRLRFHEDYSHLVLPKLVAAQMKYDYIFIDGDHRFDATMVDVFFANALLEVGGYLIMDDRPWPMVGGVVSFMTENYRHFTGDLSHPRLSVFKKTREDDRSWFDFWRFEVPRNEALEQRIRQLQSERDPKHRQG